MRIYADECVPIRLIGALEGAGYGVRLAGALAPRAADEAVLHAAVTGNDVLLTFDTDFGRLLVRDELLPCRVVLVRPGRARAQELVGPVLEVLEALARDPAPCLVVVTPQRTRFRRLGDPPGGEG